MPGCYVHLWVFLFDIFVREALGVTVQMGLYSRVELTGENQNLDNQTDLESVEWTNLNKSCLCLRFVKQTGNSTNYSPCCGKAHYYLNNNTLILENVTAQVEGVFMETIVIGSVITKFNITLDIVYPPNATGIAVTWTSNTSVSLTCEVTTTFTHIMWKREDSPILEDNRHSLSENNQTLNISNITRSDDGKYSCVATNAYGKSEIHTNVTCEKSFMHRENSTLNQESDQNWFLSGLPVITILGLSIIVFFCIIIYCHGRRGKDAKATAGDINIDLGIYEEIRDTEEVVPLPYIYTDFIKPREANQDSAAGQHVEDFGYSEIGPAGSKKILGPISSGEQFRLCPNSGEELTAEKINIHVSEATCISVNSSKLEEKQAEQIDQPQDEGNSVT